MFQAPAKEITNITHLVRKKVIDFYYHHHMVLHPVVAFTTDDLILQDLNILSIRYDFCLPLVFSVSHPFNIYLSMPSPFARCPNTFSD